jgi:dynein regulatry complex protein 1
LNFY